MDDKFKEKEEEKKELKIRDLVLYYVNRYELDTEYESDSYEDAGDGLGNYIRQISRIMQNVHIGETTLWDDINPLNGARVISIEKFEDYCFDKWADFIKNRRSHYKKQLLDLDMDRHIKRANDLYWTNKTKEVQEANDRALESGVNSLEDLDDCVIVTDKEIREKGHEMMIEALYDVFFNTFNWALLGDDLEKSIFPDVGYKAEIPPECLQARERLQNYLNYVGERKRVFPNNHIPTTPQKKS